VGGTGGVNLRIERSCGRDGEFKMVVGAIVSIFRQAFSPVYLGSKWLCVVLRRMIM
jgi:hypothetical protein